jgi:hypothetical protein
MAQALLSNTTIKPIEHGRQTMGVTLGETRGRLIIYFKEGMSDCLISVCS